MPTALKMLDMAANHSARMFQQIDNSVTRNINLALQQQQQETALTLKAAEFGEQARFNDEKLKAIQFESTLRAQEFAMNQSLMPLKMEAAQLELEITRANQNRAADQDNERKFGLLTASTDERIANQFLQTGDLDAMQKYLEYRTKAQEGVLQGGAFDFDSYNRGININFESREGGEYDAAVSNSLLKLSEQAHKQYEHKFNPDYARMANSSAANFVISGDSNMIDPMAKMLDSSSVAKVMAARSEYQTNEMNAARSLNEFERLSKQIRSIDPEDTDMVDMVNQLREDEFKKYRDLESRNNKLIEAVATGAYDFDVDPATATAPPVVNPDRDPRNVRPVEGQVMGATIDPSREEDFFTNVATFAKAIQPSYDFSDPNRDSTLDGTILENVSTKWFHEKLRSLDSDTVFNIKKKINDNIEEYGAPNREAIARLTPLIDAPVEVRISREATRILNETHGGLFRPTPQTYSSLKKDGAYTMMGGINIERGIVVIDGQHKRMLEGVREAMPKVFTKGLAGYEDILSLARSIDDSDNRQFVENELFAAYVTAALKNQIER